MNRPIELNLMVLILSLFQETHIQVKSMENEVNKNTTMFYIKELAQKPMNQLRTIGK